MAHQLLALTSLVFWAAPGAPLVSALTRGRPAASGIRLLSQLNTSYRASPLSVEGTPRRPGGPPAGDRLPDRLVRADGRSVRPHELLARPGVHILLDRDADRLDDLATGRFVAVHRLTSVPGRGITIVRPDGHIGFRSGLPRPASSPPGSPSSARGEPKAGERPTLVLAIRVLGSWPSGTPAG
ncbi:MAG TPA: hypothetical protein VFX25_10575 [Streptosporangiaceae bacterium]|nr:hypothetical protein [Streptosporangiaceae bacterium]